MKKREIDMGIDARNERYHEWLGLKLLPFMSKEQNKRFVELSKQRAIDNKYAHQQSLALLARA